MTTNNGDGTTNYDPAAGEGIESPTDGPGEGPRLTGTQTYIASNTFSSTSALTEKTKTTRASTNATTQWATTVEGVGSGRRTTTWVTHLDALKATSALTSGDEYDRNTRWMTRWTTSQQVNVPGTGHSTTMTTSWSTDVDNTRTTTNVFTVPYQQPIMTWYGHFTGAYIKTMYTAQDTLKNTYKRIYTHDEEKYTWYDTRRATTAWFETIIGGSGGSRTTSSSWVVNTNVSSQRVTQIAKSQYTNAMTSVKGASYITEWNTSKTISKQTSVQTAYSYSTSQQVQTSASTSWYTDKETSAPSTTEWDTAKTGGGYVLTQWETDIGVGDTQTYPNATSIVKDPETGHSYNTQWATDFGRVTAHLTEVPSGPRITSVGTQHVTQYVEKDTSFKLTEVIFNRSTLKAIDTVLSTGQYTERVTDVNSSYLTSVVNITNVVRDTEFYTRHVTTDQEVSSRLTESTTQWGGESRTTYQQTLLNTYMPYLTSVVDTILTTEYIGTVVTEWATGDPYHLTSVQTHDEARGRYEEVYTSDGALKLTDVGLQRLTMKDGLEVTTEWISQRETTTGWETVKHIMGEVVERTTEWMTHHNTPMTSVTTQGPITDFLTQFKDQLTQIAVEVEGTTEWSTEIRQPLSKITRWVTDVTRTSDYETSWKEFRSTIHETHFVSEWEVSVKVGSRNTAAGTFWDTQRSTLADIDTVVFTSRDTGIIVDRLVEDTVDRITQWGTQGIEGALEATNWLTEDARLTDRVTHVLSSPVGGSRVGVGLRSTTYLTGENSTRYQTHVVTQHQTWEEFKRLTSAETDYSSSSLQTSSTEYNVTVTRSTSQETTWTTEGAYGTVAEVSGTTEWETEAVVETHRDTIRPISVDLTRTTRWETDARKAAVTSYVTAHDTVVGDNLYSTSHLTQVLEFEYGPEYLSAQMPSTQAPPLDVMGTFEFKAPYDRFSGQLLKCLSVEDMGLLTRRGVDVYGRYYQPYGLSRHIYLSDFDAGAKLATLSTIDEQVELVVPTTYIVSVPGDSYVAYSRLMLTVDLGLLPDALDLKVTEQEIANLLQRTLGRVPDVSVSRLPMDGGVTVGQHVLLERNRLRDIKSVPSLQAQIDRLERRLQDEIDRNSVLETALLEVTDGP